MMRTRWVVGWVVVVLAGLGLAAGPASAAPAAFSCSPASGTLGGLAVLQHVTATAESGNDRIVFEFATLPAPSGVGCDVRVSPSRVLGCCTGVASLGGVHLHYTPHPNGAATSSRLPP